MGQWCNYTRRMVRHSQIGIARRTRSLWSVLALLSIAFHVGLAAIHCHDLEGFGGRTGHGIERVQDSPPLQTDDDDGACVICQLLSVFKGTPPQTLAVVSAIFAGLIVQLFVWKTAFVPLYLRWTAHPRDPPLAHA